MSFNHLALGQSALNSPWPWFVALFPIVGIPLQSTLSNFTTIPSAGLWIITLGGCALGCMSDQQALLQSYAIRNPLDHPWIIPRYLYRRSQIHDKPPVAAMVWCALMAAYILAPWTGWLEPFKIWMYS